MFFPSCFFVFSYDEVLRCSKATLEAEDDEEDEPDDSSLAEESWTKWDARDHAGEATRFQSQGLKGRESVDDGGNDGWSASAAEAVQAALVAERERRLARAELDRLLGRRRRQARFAAGDDRARDRHELFKTSRSAQALARSTGVAAAAVSALRSQNHGEAPTHRHEAIQASPETLGIDPLVSPVVSSNAWSLGVDAATIRTSKPSRGDSKPDLVTQPGEKFVVALAEAMVAMSASRRSSIERVHRFVQPKYSCIGMKKQFLKTHLVRV